MLVGICRRMRFGGRRCDEAADPGFVAGCGIQILAST